jgi:hypothetical protein
MYKALDQTGEGFLSDVIAAVDKVYHSHVILSESDLIIKWL